MYSPRLFPDAPEKRLYTIDCIQSNLRSKVGILNAYSAGRLLPTRTMILYRREKYIRTEYAQAYDAGCFGHKNARNFIFK